MHAVSYDSCFVAYVYSLNLIDKTLRNLYFTIISILTYRLTITALKDRTKSNDLSFAISFKYQHCQLTAVQYGRMK